MVTTRKKSARIASRNSKTSVSSSNTTANATASSTSSKGKSSTTKSNATKKRNLKSVKSPTVKKARKSTPASSSTPKKSSNKTSKQTTILVKGKAPVDPVCVYASTHHVVEHDGVMMDCMLNQTNIGNNNNKFYLLQILAPDSGAKSYSVWFRWGRVGNSGQTSMNTFSDIETAVSKFKTKFNAKTKNSWDNKDNFKAHPGKYTMIELDYGKQEIPVDKKTKEPLKVKIPKSKLNSKVQNLISMIFDTNIFRKQMVEMKLDLDKMPLGKLTSNQIKKGYACLKEIESVFSLPGSTSANRALLMELCSRYYTIIPHAFGMSRPPLIDSTIVLKAQMEKLEMLADIEIATKIIKKTSKANNPIDEHYHSLMCNIKPISQKSKEFKYIVKSVDQTHAQTHRGYRLVVNEVFELDREGETERFKPFDKVDNHQLLWHGSRMSNFAGILSQGLRIAPPEAPSTGYMFGKGVYWANSVSKSANYTHASRRNPDAFLILGQVALGSPYEKTNSEMIRKLDKKYLHTWGKGRSTPSVDDLVSWPKEPHIKFHTGKLVKSDVSNSSLLYDELIVYDTSQIKMRYLVHCKMEFS